MRLNFKGYLTFGLMVLALVGCKQEAPSEADNQNIEPSDTGLEQEKRNTENFCKNTGIETGIEYEVITGVVQKTQKELPYGDCSTSDCFEKRKNKLASFFAEIKVTTASFEETKSPVIFLYTKPESVQSLSLKSPYMEEGKTYEFCAKRIEPKTQKFKEMPFYQIDFVETIQEIK